MDWYVQFELVLDSQQVLVSLSPGSSSVVLQKPTKDS